MTNPFALDNEPQAPAQPAPSPPASVNAPAPQTPPPPPGAESNEDPFAGPAPQRPRAPRLRDLYGRLVLVIPHKLEKGIRSQFNDKDGNPQFQDRLTMDLVVLDGGEIHYGGSPESIPPTPHDKTATVPAKFDRVFDSHAGIISQCRDALAKRQAGKPGMVLGRLTTGEKKGGNNAPFILQPFTEADAAIARQYLATVDPFA